MGDQVVGVDFTELAMDFGMHTCVARTSVTWKQSWECRPGL
jgi:hypothetical protein